MKRGLKIIGVILVLGFLGIQMMRPERNNPPSPPERHLAARLPMSLEAAAVFDRSCRDCHSNETRWPWYSEIAPTSWFVAGHVNHARSHLNISEWDRYEPRKAAHHLEEMCEKARNGTMPLPSYLWIHHGARLSEADIEALCAWTETASAALQLSERDDH
ncbi:MAG: heme-binding domain-containing protein [Candidatus Polarisedimenticolia bacterium]